MVISSVSAKISAETALIQSCFFLLWISDFSALFQRISALFSSVSERTALKELWFSAGFSLWKFGVSALFQRKSALFQRKSALKQLWFSADFLALKISCFRENQRCSALNQLCFRENQRWFLALKICVFSAVQSWISAVQRFSGNEQRWNRPESILTQSWSALNVSETSTRVFILHVNNQSWHIELLGSKCVWFFSRQVDQNYIVSRWCLKHMAPFLMIGKWDK